MRYSYSEERDKSLARFAHLPIPRTQTKAFKLYQSHLNPESALEIYCSANPVNAVAVYV